MANSINLTLVDNSKSAIVLSANVRKVVATGTGATVMAISKGARLKSLVVTQTPAQVAALMDGLVAFTDLVDATTVYINVNSILLVTPEGNGSKMIINAGYLPLDVSVTATPEAVQAIINSNSSDLVGDSLGLVALTYDFATKSAAKTFNAVTGVDIATNTITSVAHGFVVNDTLVFSTAGTLPTGISAATAYYVVAKTLDTYQVSATRGGGVLDITAVGVGTITATSNILGIVSFGTAGVLADKTIIKRSYMDVATSVTSGGSAQIAISTTQGANQIVSAAVLGTVYAAGLHEGLSDGTMAASVKMTASREVIATITVAVLTAGKLKIYLETVPGA